MKTIFTKMHYLLFLLANPDFYVAQARLILNNNSFLVIENNCKLVVENSSSNAITTSGTGGNIISENENNSLIWKIGNATGTYIIPFTTTPVSKGGNGTKIPLTVTINTAGNSSGSISFSTYETASDQNTIYPSDVTNMNSTTLGSDASLYAVDRFWIIDADTYSSKPSVTIEFTYDDAANEFGNTNTITESNLVAQRFNSSINNWEQMAFGTVNTSTNKVSAASVSGTNLYRSWTLGDVFYILKAELLTFSVLCHDNSLQFNWQTSKENNTKYFSLEASNDGITFTEKGKWEASGFSGQLKSYSYSLSQSEFNDEKICRLKTTDKDGSSSYHYTALPNCTDNQTFSFYPNPSSDKITLKNNYNSACLYRIRDLTGRLLMESLVTKESEKEIEVSALAEGTYVLEIISSQQNVTYKFLKQN